MVCSTNYNSTNSFDYVIRKVNDNDSRNELRQAVSDDGEQVRESSIIRRYVLQ